MFFYETTTQPIFGMALGPHAQELDIWTITPDNLSNTIEISKHIMQQLLRLKLLVEVEPLYTLHFLRSLTKQKEKRRNSRYRRKSVPMHLQMSSKAFTTL
jgi:hypothetical protein